ncbi:MAG: hypothetical protein HYX87_07845 [Chloroflexi bacterium]|nr:hypothetical protein [Chloroflexota bacterium]
MDQAKAVINLKEGNFQLEGPVDFVREYLERFAAAKGLQSVPQELQIIPAKGVTKDTGKAVRRAYRRRRRVSSVGAIQAALNAGFLSQAKSAREINQHLAEKGRSYSPQTIRIGLRKLIDRGLLSKTSAGRGTRYGQSG